MTSCLRELDLREYGDWPLRYRVGACVLLALLAFGLPWYWLTRPTSSQWQALRSAEHELQTQLLHARQRVDALPAFSPLPPDERPPPPVNLPALMTAIAETAQAAGLHGAQFRPLSPPATDASARDGTYLELRLHGTWPQLTRFATDLTVLTSDAILSLQDVRLRAQPQTAVSALLLELSATVRIHTRASAHPIPGSTAPLGDGVQRNPFMGSAIRSRQTNAHTVIGSLGDGQEQVELILTADGQLRRVDSGLRRPST